MKDQIVRPTKIATFLATKRNQFCVIPNDCRRQPRPPPQTPGLDPSLSDKPVLENKVRVWSTVCCYQKISVPIKLSYENSYRSSDAWFLHFFKLLVKIRITAICNVATEQFWNRDRNFKWRIASRETIDSTVDWFPRLKDPDVTTIWRFQTGLRTATYGGGSQLSTPLYS